MKSSTNNLMQPMAFWKAPKTKMVEKGKKPKLEYHLTVDNKNDG